MPKEDPKSIILFGGSFDPIHLGHINIGRVALKLLNAEKVVYIPAKNPRWKSSSDVKHRYNMLKLALKDEPNAEISTFELEQKDPVSYSIITAKHFKEIYPDRKLYFLIGFDQLDQLSEWHDIEEMSELVQFVAFARRGYPRNHESISKFNVLIVDRYIENSISSSKIRALQCLDTTREVIDYIIDNNLYFCKSVKAYLTKQRYEHSISVARLAYDIAKANNLEPTTAFLAGILHDIGKNMDLKETLNIIEEFYPEYINYPSCTLHQFVGSYIAQVFFNIHNQTILDAITYHTTGRGIMSTYEKIIYAADKIEPTRGFDSSDLIKSCMNNIEEGFKEVVKDNYLYLMKKNPDLISVQSNQLSRDMFKNYIKEIYNESN